MTAHDRTWGPARRRAHDEERPERNRRSTSPISFNTLSKLVGTWGTDYEIDAPTLSADGEIIRGRMREYKCHSGLRLHTTDAIELHDLNTRIDVEPALSVGIFLQGELQMGIDDNWYHLGHEEAATGHMWMTTKRSTLIRKSNKGARIRKVLLSIPRDWLDQMIGADAAAMPVLDRFLNTHLSTFEWRPSKRAVALAEQILRPSTAPNVLQTMAVESRAIEIIAETLSTLVGQAPLGATASQSVKSVSRAQKVRDYLESHMDGDLDLETVATEVGMSVGSMQRAFKAAYGTTVVEFIRGRRLHRAREAMDNDGISVSEAAYLAGYSSPANFSTAFKKLFGLTPSQAKN